MRKVLYVILDGLGDLPLEELGKKTPLEAAQTPHMDSLAKQGIQGLLYPVEKHIAPESDIAVISLLGYDAHRLYTGRGPLESFAEGIEVNDGDLALRVNFATAESDSSRIVDRRVGRNLTTEEATQLAREINEKVSLEGARFIFKNTIGHRGVLVIKKEGDLSGWITNTDPAYEREGVFGVALEKFEPFLQEAKPMEGYENHWGAIVAANLLNAFTDASRKVLTESSVNKKRIQENKLAANLILSRDAGDNLPKFRPMHETTGLKFGCFVQMPVEKGIALLCGMKVIDVPLPSGDLEKDYTYWAELASAKIEEFDGLYIHIKGPDEPAHDGDYIKKKEIIEFIDKFFFGKLLSLIPKQECIICVTADHSTVCKVKAHTADPVPLLIYSPGLKDSTESFGEHQARQGKLGALLGRELIYKLGELAQK
ncbi:MAG: 2,3-bisphosphoglycerate-independent phosphoglycerate mutase [Candidatus Omnitrophota bacterium]|nr:MAG: 2,3-bisphosphoglycerate-independent phosphoglycerate mutase [Candidatus Omnitrophota bacterium]